MQISRRTFRFLVILPLILSFFSYGLGQMPFSKLPEKAQEANRERSRVIESMPLGMTIMLGAVFIYLLGMLGMMVFWGPARMLYVVAFLIEVAWSASISPHVHTGIDHGMKMIMTFVIGLVVAVSYTSNIADLFNPPSTSGE